MTADRFPYEMSRWIDADRQHAKDWYDELERLGPQNVRLRLAQSDAGSRGAFAIGSVNVMTIGFAEEWLAWNERRRDALEEARHRRQVFWTRFAALAATATAMAGTVGGAWTIFHK